MLDLIEELFGVYTPVTYEVTEIAADGSVITNEVIASGLAGVDWTWIAGVLLFAIALISVFKIMGVLLRK